MRFKTILLFLSLLVFPLTAFAQSNALTGKWEVMELKEGGKDISLDVARSGIIIEFTKTWNIYVRAFCNNESGKYSIKNGKFKVKSMITTLKACDDEVMNVEQRLGNALSRVTRYEIGNKTLTLRDERRQNVVILNRSTPQTAQNFMINDWEEISRCALRFYLPDTLEDLRTQADDSCVASFEDPDLRVSLDYGSFSLKYEKSETTQNFKEETIEIDGRKCQLVTFLDTRPYAKQNPHRRFVAGLYTEVKDSPVRRALNMTISGKSLKQMEIAREIFKTLKFY